MKFPFVFVLLLDIPRLHGQQRIGELQYISLKLTFPPFYNSYIKFCCKLYPGGCHKVLDSAGYAYDSLSWRVTKVESDGWIEFQISNVQFVDAGPYRCAIQGGPSHIYVDYYVSVYETFHHNSQTQPPPTATIKTPTTSTALPESIGPEETQDLSDSSRAPWRFTLPLALIVSLIVMISITSGIVVVCCRRRARCKQSEIQGGTLCEPLKREAPDASGTVYTTVDFKPRKSPEAVYANLRMHKTGAGPHDTEHDGMVEYSTLAVHL